MRIQSTLSALRENWWLFFNQSIQCELCLSTPDQNAFICTHCQDDLPWSGLCCPQCSEPVLTEGRCGRCQKKPPAFDYSACTFLYTHPVDRWIQRCKDRGDIRFAHHFTRLMLKDPPLLSVQPDALVVIPAAKSRLLTRGFNLSQLLAHNLSQHISCPVLEQVLKKTHRSEQRRLSGRERRSKDTGLISGEADLTGRHLLIIDDVMTTGATLEQAARLLKQQGASTVGAWCFARTPRQGFQAY